MAARKIVILMCRTLTDSKIAFAARQSIPTPVKLLTVDDDPLVLDFIESALTQPELEISRSSDPARAWETICRIRPDIVIVDLLMPEIGGMELLERIVEWDSGIEVVLLSGEDSTTFAVDAIRKGACDYLTKPISVAVLRDRIGGLIALAQIRIRAGATRERNAEYQPFCERW